MIIFEILSALLFLSILPGSLELLIVTLGSLLPRNRISQTFQFPQKLAVVIPAHNEEDHIQKTLESLKQNDSEFSVFVVADNCTDDTPEIARKYGATVLERRNDEFRGKHHALNYAFDILLKEKFDSFLIVDADCICASNLIHEIKTSLSTDLDAVQVKYAISETNINFKQRLLRIAFNAFVYLRPLGRQGWNLSAGVSGTGFAVKKYVLENVKIPSDTVVEDACFHLKLVQHGYFVDFNPNTYVLSDLPKSIKNISTQRSRWEGGRLKLLIDELPSCLKQVLRGNFKMIEPCLDLMLLPLSYHAILLILLLLIPVSWGKTIAFYGLLILAMHLFVSMILTKATWRDYGALLLSPLYLAAKLLFVFRIFDHFKSKPLWEKTSRENDQEKSNSNNHKERL